MPVFPEDMGGGEGRVPAEVDLDRRREPAEPVGMWPVVGRFRVEEGRLREVHLPGHRPHPGVLGRRVEHADGRRVAGEREIGEGVDLDNAMRHRGASVLGGFGPRRAGSGPVRSESGAKEQGSPMQSIRLIGPS